MDQFLKDHQLNKAEFGVTDGSISVWISGPQDKNPSKCYVSVFVLYKTDLTLQFLSDHEKYLRVRKINIFPNALMQALQIG